MSAAASVKTKVFELIRSFLPDAGVEVRDDLPLLGSAAALDSMRLVELCLALEDLAAETGAEFDWTSEEAMSKSRSMFRTAGALADEFVRQTGSQS